MTSPPIIRTASEWCLGVRELAKRLRIESEGDCDQDRTVAGPASPGAESTFVSAVRGPSNYRKGDQ
jgi:hypothetical protein